MARITIGFEEKWLGLNPFPAMVLHGKGVLFTSRKGFSQVKVEEKICMNESTTNWSCFDKKWYFRSDFLALNEF